MRKHVRKAIIRHRQLQDLLEYAQLASAVRGGFVVWSLPGNCNFGMQEICSEMIENKNGTHSWGGWSSNMEILW